MIAVVLHIETMNRFEDMDTFLRIIDAGGISKAAVKKGIAKSALSRRLSDLEHRLGAQLVNRSTRGLSLTEAGRSFYERCKRIMEDVDEAEQMVSADSTELRGTISMTAALSFGVLHLGPLINVFLNQHPDLAIDLDLTDRRVELIEEGIDLAIRIGRLSDSRLIARKLAPMRRIACASPAYLKTHGTPHSPRDLRNHIGLASGLLPDSIYWQFTGNNGENITGRPTSRLRANNGDVLVQAACEDMGICAVPLFISSRAIKRGDLVPILTDFRLREEGIYAVYPPARYQSHRVRMLIDFLAREYGADPSWELGLFN